MPNTYFHKASGLRKWQLVGIKLNLETSWGSFLFEVTKSTSAIFLSWVKGSKVKVSNGTHIWTWMKAHIPWQLGMGEFSSCKAYGDFYFSPAKMCYFMCSDYHILPCFFREHLFLVRAANSLSHNLTPQLGHMTSMSQSESSLGFLTRFGGKELSFLSRL